MKLCWNSKDPGDSLVIISRKDMEVKHPDLISKSDLLAKDTPIHFCRLMLFQGILSGTFNVPQKEHPVSKKRKFGLILHEQTLYIIGEEKKMQRLINAFMEQYDVDVHSPLEFILRFLNYLIEEDVYFLEEYNGKLEEIEEDIFDGRQAGMERFIMETRKDMSVLNNYYLQLDAVGETLQETIIPEDCRVENAMASLFNSRIAQLLNMVADIKDYTSQIWNLRQTQLSDRQNKISTILTIITTIFLPLTLITGWYGMNFKNMPLIDNHYGYYIIIGLCLVIVAMELLYLRSKNWLREQGDEWKGGSKYSFSKKEIGMKGKKKHKKDKDKDENVTDPSKESVPSEAKNAQKQL